MGTTPNYALRYPGSSDSPNGPVQLQNLATDVDTVMKTRTEAVSIVLTRTSAQNIADATDAAISWTSETRDTHGLVSVGGGITAVTIPASYAGDWLAHCTANFVWETTANKLRILAPILGGAIQTDTEDRRLNQTAVTNQPHPMAVTYPFHVSAQTTIGFNVWQNSGGTLALGSAGRYPKLTLTLLRRT